MTKTALAFVTLLALLLSSCFVSSSLNFTESQTQGVPNLLTNPSFNPYSMDPKTSLRGWNLTFDPPNIPKDKVVIDLTEGLEGNSSVRIDASEHAVMLVSDSFQVIRYGGYYIRVGARSTSSEAPEIVLRFIAFKDNGKIYNSFSKKIKTSPEWNKGAISAGFIRPGVNFGRVAILIPPFKDGSIWIDDAGCWKVHHFRID